MRQTTDTSRRRFLATALGSGLLPLLRTRRGWAVSLEPHGDRPLEQRLVDMLNHRRSAHRIGSIYLGNTPGEANARVLTDLIVTDIFDRQEDLHQMTLDDIRKRFQDRTRQDFAAGRVVRLEGWLIAVTEARLCALSALV